MKSIDYLRGVVRRTPAAPPAAPKPVAAVRTPAAPPPAPAAPRDLLWENAARIVATCTCEPTLYSRCYPSLHGGRPEA